MPTDDREPFREARAAGLKARHEQRLENATYTAAEVKVLTEDACKVAAEAGRRIGRAEMAEEIADRCLRRAQFAERVPEPVRSGVREGMIVTWLAAERMARELASQPAGAAADGPPSAPGYSDLPQDSRAGRSPQDNTGLEEDCGCIYAPGLGDHITTHCREGHTPGGPR